MTSITKRQNSIVFFLIPILGVIFIFRIFPLFLSFSMSFYDWSIFNKNFIGLNNYFFFFRDRIAKKSLFNTLYFTIVYVPLNVSFALLFALLVNQTNKLRTFYRIAFFLPLMMSLVAASILWKLLYLPQYGLFSITLNAMGLKSPLWLVSVKTAMPSIIVMNLWKNVGFNVVLFMAGLTNIPVSLYEAAIVDGATWRQKFWKVTLPLLRPTLLFVMVMTVIRSIQVFTQVYIMTDGGPADSTRVFVQYLRSVSFLNLEMGYGAALSFILFIIILIITIFQMKFLQTKWEY